MAITNLTGTVWELKNTISVSTSATYNVKFELLADATQFTSFKIDNSKLTYGSVDVYSSATWTDAKYKRIRILGGTDVETSGLITYLSTNGTLKGGGMKFTQIPTDTFSKLQLNAGVIVSQFTPSTGTMASADILGATSGGVTFNATPTFEDWGDDIDNAPKNMLELKKLTEWEVKLTGNFVTMSTTLAKKLIGAADIGAVDTTKVTPRNDLATTDFEDLWFVGDYSDKNGDTNGGFIAIKMLNTLSTGGFQLKSSDKAKGTFSFEFTAHYSQSAQDTVPFEVYVKAGSAEPTQL